MLTLSRNYSVDSSEIVHQIKRSLGEVDILLDPNSGSIVSQGDYRVFELDSQKDTYTIRSMAKYGKFK
jgi:hypothetical protein